jgi:ribosomal-protein-alanine N-acetyltransferase
MTPLIIQKIPPTEARCLMLLHQASFPTPWDETYFTQALSQDSMLALGVWRTSSKQCLGFVLLQLVPEEAEIITLCIHPNFRRQGLARALLREVLELKTITSCFLEVTPTNQPAVKLYETFGFRVIGKRPQYYQRAEGSFEDAFIYKYSKKEQTLEKNT